MINKQNDMLVKKETGHTTIVSGPLTGLLIKGRVDILNWFLTILESKRSVKDIESVDSRILVMLQRQKELFKDPKERSRKTRSYQQDRNPRKDWNVRMAVG